MFCSNELSRDLLMFDRIHEKKGRLGRNLSVVVLHIFSNFIIPLHLLKATT